jgi:thiol-disulfide isomerase/thioredoxin
MKSTILLLLGLLSVKGFSQTSSVKLNKSKPEVGEQVIVTYSGKLVKEGTKMECVLHYTPQSYIPSRGIPTSIINNQLVGTFTIPDSVTYFYIVIFNKKEYDNNEGKGYGFNIYKNGNPVKWTFLSEGNSIFFNKFFFNGDVDTERALKLVEKELVLNPDLENKAHPYYVKMLSRVANRRSEAVNLARLNYDKILKTGIDEQFTYIYTEILTNGNYRKGDSLLSLVAEKYPNGSTAFDKKMMLLNGYSIYNPDTAITIYNNIKRDFPKMTLKGERVITEGLLAAYAHKKDIVCFNEVLNTFIERDNSQQAKIIAATSCNNMASNLLNSNEIQRAKFFAEKSITFHKQYDSLSIYHGIASETYANILYKLRDKKGAILNQSKAVYLRNNIFPNVNQKLIEYLIDDKQFDEAFAKAGEFIINNLSNSTIDSLYKVAFFAKGGTEGEFIKVSANAKVNAEVEYISQLKKKIINEEAPEIQLSDLDGNKVKLSDYHGKTVIIDFWATWCRPCIASFPAMKEIINQLKDNSVKFLFIDTMEVENLENKNAKIKKILDNMKVSGFQVLLDEVTDLNYRTTTAYKVSSIPAKFVIDKSGRIRYQSTGFSSDENLIKELKTVVKLVSEN